MMLTAASQQCLPWTMQATHFTSPPAHGKPMLLVQSTHWNFGPSVAAQLRCTLHAAPTSSTPENSQSTRHCHPPSSQSIIAPVLHLLYTLPAPFPPSPLPPCPAHVCFASRHTKPDNARPWQPCSNTQSTTPPTPKPCELACIPNTT